jgi:hypothetical protein
MTKQVRAGSGSEIINNGFGSALYHDKGSKNIPSQFKIAYFDLASDHFMKVGETAKIK